MVFIARDEFEGALLQADFNSRAREAIMLATKYTPPAKLKVFVFATDLVTSKYAVGAFLSVLVCNTQAHIVGEALIGATTPSKLSMSTTTPLKKAVLKISHQNKAADEVAGVQTKLRTPELRDMRMRDLIRTAVLAFDPSSRTPELVILCPCDLANDVTRYSNGTSTRLPAWSARAPAFRGDVGSVFANGTISAAQSYPTALNHASRLNQIATSIANVNRKYRPNRVARLALALHSGTMHGAEIDLAGRPEQFIGQSERGDRAIGLFNRILDVAFPWSASTPTKNAENLHGRREVMRLYTQFCGDREQKN
jgi:hypothetical protein